MTVNIDRFSPVAGKKRRVAKTTFVISRSLKYCMYKVCINFIILILLGNFIIFCNININILENTYQ